MRAALRPAQMALAATKVFCLPADLQREGTGVPPWSGRALCPNWLRICRSPTARLPLRGLPVVTLRAQRTQTVERVRLGDPLRHQLTPGQGEVVGDHGRATARQTPRIPVQVRLTDALPPCGVAPLCARTALLLGLAPMLGTAPARGQLGAPGCRARGGRGLRGTGQLQSAGVTVTWGSSSSRRCRGCELKLPQARGTREGVDD